MQVHTAASFPTDLNTTDTCSLYSRLNGSALASILATSLHMGLGGWTDWPPRLGGSPPMRRCPNTTDRKAEIPNETKWHWDAYFAALIRAFVRLFTRVIGREKCFFGDTLLGCGYYTPSVQATAIDCCGWPDHLPSFFVRSDVARIALLTCLTCCVWAVLRNRLL